MKFFYHKKKNKSKPKNIQKPKGSGRDFLEVMDKSMAFTVVMISQVYAYLMAKNVKVKIILFAFPNFHTKERWKDKN